ncbi:MAG: hypothetical protein NVSMB25_08640 [Thermoleophilaceae bacterium]
MSQLAEPPGAPSPAAAAAPLPAVATARPITRRELGLLALSAVALSLVMNWPLPAHLGSHIGQDLGDPVRTAWQLAWEGHAALHSPLHLYQANAFWPLPNSFAFSDSLLGYLPFALIGRGAHAALVRYNLLFLLTYALAFAGAYLLARELRLRPAAAAVAGVAFAYAPFRLTMNGHLHVISSGGIPLALFLLLRGYRSASWRHVAAGWLIALWQLSLGFTLGLQLAYLLAALAALALVAWLRGGRPPIARALIVASVVGAVGFGLVGGLQARPLLRVSRDFSTAKRSAKEIAKYSASLRAFLSAPPEDRVWGGVTSGIRHTLRSPNEQNQFPGLMVALLALLGLVLGQVWAIRLRFGLAIAIVVVALCSLGLGFAGGHLYRVIELLPGWNAVRTPGRLVTLTSLGLALLAAAGAEQAIGVVARRLPGRTRFEAAAVPALCALALAGVILVEGRGSMPNPSVPSVPGASRAAAAPHLDLPSNPAYDRIYQFWSSERLEPVVNGVATFSIPAQDALRDWMNEFPNGYSVYLLRHLGVRTVLLHLDVEHLPIPKRYQSPYPSDVAAAARRSVRGLPVKRVVRIGQTIRYDLAPLPVTRAQAQAFFRTIHV